MKFIKRRIIQLTIVLLFLSALLAVGHSNAQDYLDSQFALMRFNADGSLDNTFSGGKILTDFGPSTNEWATDVAITGSGQVVVVGTAYVQDKGNVFAVARYDTNGNLDTSFNGSGMVLTDIVHADSEHAEAVVMAGGGKIVVAGWGLSDGSSVFAVVRYNADGSLDTTFAKDGRVLTDFTASTEERAYAVDIDDNGQIVLAGWATLTDGPVFALARYNADGSLDETFQGGDAGPGKVLTDFASSNNETATAMIITRDEKIVVGGTAYVSTTGNQFALARYNMDGSLDTAFDGDGKVLTDFSSTGTEIVEAVALPGGGKIITAGWAFDGNTSFFALARYNADGALDTTFDGDGKVLTDIGTSSNERATAVGLDENGRIIAAGRAIHDNGRTFALTCYNTNGSLDGTFGANGIYMAGFPAIADEEAWGMVIDHNNRIVVVGGAGTLIENH